MTWEEYQPYYLAFCRATKRMPWEPTGRQGNADFMAWIWARWTAGGEGSAGGNSHHADGR